MTVPPNVVILITDDLTWGDLACHGNPVTRTPNLDRLHRESARLTRYCSGPLCTPARAALMTGRHPYRTRAFDTYLGRSTIDPDERTLAEVLRDRGYATGLFGKWHLGDHHPSRPHDKGFQEALYHHGGGLRQPSNLGRDAYFDPDLMHNGRLVRAPGYCTDIFTDAAIRFIGQNRSGPFFVYLATNAPHSPHEVAEEWAEPYRRLDVPETWARLYGMNENIDWNLGRINIALDQLGLSQNTLLIFTSDHGACPSAKINGRNRFNGGLRGQKGSMYEGGIRAPCFWRWPAHFPAGRDVDRIANPIDFLPTIAAACGASAPADRAIDGVNLIPLLSGRLEPVEWPDRSICMQWHRGDIPQRYRNAAIIRQRWKWCCPDGTNRDELYDIETDPFEKQNVAAAHPDLVKTLRAEYENWFADVSRTRGPTPEENYAPPRIILGDPRENPTVLTRQDWRNYSQPEGWQDDTPGYWLVRVATTGVYSVVIDLPTQAAELTLRFACGATAATHRIPPNTPICALNRAGLDAGDHQLEAYLEGSGKRIGSTRVHVRLLEEVAA